MFQACRSDLGRQRRFGRKVVVEPAVGKAGGLHQIGHANSVEAVLVKQTAGCFDDALAIICGLLFGQFHRAISSQTNSQPDIIMMYILVVYGYWLSLSHLKLNAEIEKSCSCSRILHISR